MKSMLVSKLPVITDPHVFFDAKKVLGLDVLNVDTMEPLTRLKLQIAEKVLQFNESYYMPIAVKGEPQNFYRKLNEGIPFEPMPGEPAVLGWDRDLKSMLKKKKIYDLSFHLKADQFIYERGFLYYTFIFPYNGNTLTKKCHNYHLSNTRIVKATKI